MLRSRKSSSLFFKTYSIVNRPYLPYRTAWRGYSTQKMIKGQLALTPSNPLTIHHTLPCGQSFRWKLIGDNKWRGVMDRWVVTLEQKSPELIEYSAMPDTDPVEFKNKLTDYLHMDGFILEDYYKEWSTSKATETKKLDINEAFAKAASKLTGLRVLRQDPYECTFSFICTQNNHIKRIFMMIEKLCEKYGTCIGSLDEINYYTFPTLNQLLLATEGDLKELGFGYRAKYIVGSAKLVHENGGEDWLNSLRKKSKEEAKQSLLTLHGVGPKVADCISLFSLDHLDVVPVDTHVWQIATKFLPHLSKSSASNLKSHIEINEFFVSKFGSAAGWAHTILFSAELSGFKELMAESSSNKKRKGQDLDQLEQLESETPSKRVKTV